MLKGKIPCQAVSNKLEIFNLAEKFAFVRRLEMVLVAKRIFFKKIAIISQGQSPKIRGTLCNIPVENIFDIYILPRPADNNCLIIVKLKRKVEYKGHVISESVRPHFLKRLLLYLKENNFLYSNIQVNLENIPKVLLPLNQQDSIAQLLVDIANPIEIVLKNKPDSIDRKNEEDEFQSSAYETTLICGNTCKSELKKAHSVAPG